MARCCWGRCGAAVLGRSGGAEHGGGTGVAHQGWVPRALLLVPAGDPVHTHHFAEQILVLPLVALLFLAGGRGQLLLLTVDGMEMLLRRYVEQL